MRNCYLSVLLMSFLVSCHVTDETLLNSDHDINESVKPDEVDLGEYSLVDKDATYETKLLYKKLIALSKEGSGMLFGHESSNMQGVYFDKFNPGQMLSDVKRSVNDYPAVFGYDLNRGYARLLPIMQQAAEHGGVISISFHMKYPTKNSYHYSDLRDIPQPVTNVLPGGKYHKEFLMNLDSIADVASRLIVDGKQVPILFRPWHEHTGGWYWWGSVASTPEEYTDLWKFTVNYLKNTKKIHNLIYVYSPSRPEMNGGYEVRNPGPEWIDIAGFDCYMSVDNTSEIFMKQVGETIKYARKHKKISAIAEFGYKHGINKCDHPQWFTKEFLQPLVEKGYISSLAYCMTWQDSADKGHWIPQEEDLQYDDFVKFYSNDLVHFLSEYKTLFP